MRAPGVPGLAGLGTMECFCLWAGHAMDIKPAHDTDCQTVACLFDACIQMLGSQQGASPHLMHRTIRTLRKGDSSSKPWGMLTDAGDELS